MAYIVKSSEKVRGIGADYETKAMLYLMNCREDSNEVNFFAIDFYNDVTGLNVHADKAWDVQSKGARSGGPKDVGRELVTLFKNFMSELHFDYLILFLASAPVTLRKDNSLTTFGIENVKDGALKRLREGFLEEASEKTYIEEEWLSDKNIDAFFNAVIFVIDDKSKADYIRELMNINPKYIPNDRVLDGIFNTIRDAQAGKKNNESVEGEIVTHLRDVLNYDRCLKTKEIRLMVLNSFINRDVMNVSIPLPFYPIIQRFDGIRQNEILEDCKLQIASALFDKTYTDEFWDLLSLICDTIINNKKLSTIQTYDLIVSNDLVRNPRLDIRTVQYLIAVLKEALRCL